jgi:hypothetical protein
MGLKFRRGTNAQKSGSLAFGEPYVNTDLGTLQIGGLTGDITLGASGTGSAGTFSGISGSSLDITGYAKIDGNLTLGGTITIGDASTDNVVVNADLSSSIIPNDDNAFDLGSTSKRYRAIHGTNIYGTINATNGVISGSSQLNTLATTGSNTFKGNQTIIGSGAGFAAYISTSVNDATLGLDTTANVNALYFLKNGEKNFELSYDTTNANGIFRLLPYDNNSFFEIGNPSNSGANYVFISEPTYGNVLIGPGIGNGVSSLVGSTPATDKVQVTGNLYVSGAINANSFTGSIASTNGVVSGSSQITYASISSIPAGIVSGSSQVTPLLPTGVVSGSSQITLSSTTGFSAYSTSVDSRIATEKGRVDAILLAADADKDSFAEIVTLINSVDTTNDTAFASFATSSNATNTAQSARLSSLETYTGSNDTTNTAQNSRLTTLESVTGSYETKGRGIVSGSSQIVGSSITTNTITIGSTAIALGGTATTIAGLTSVSSTGFTGALTGNASTATTLATARTINGTSFNGSADITIANLVSGSSQITAGSTTNFATDVKTQLNTNTVVSGSGQINVASTTGDIALGTRTSGNYVASLVAGTNITLSNNSGEGATPTIGLTNNAITIAGTSTSLGGTITAEQIRTAIGTVVTGSSQISLGSASGNIALATQTTGDYVASLVAGTGVTLSNNSGENATPTIAIGQSVATNATPTFGNLTINGSINATGDITAYYTSDKRHKNNIQPITDALLKVSKLNGVTWEWNDDVHEVTKSTPKTGLIAQEVQEVLPEVIKEREDGFLALDYSKMMGLMVEAIKEQQTQIHNLTLEIENLKKVKGL